MYSVRRWVARHPRIFERLYGVIERVFVGLAPALQRIGYQRLERPVAGVEKTVKGFLFDSKMCGTCTLGATGMVCPMNCPKKMRNGPCGGVRPNGHCEINADMPCVWVDAYAGSQRLQNPEQIGEIQGPVDHRQQGTSSWLRETRRKTGFTETTGGDQ